MQAFLQAISDQHVSLEKLITHRVPLADAKRAYDVISGAVNERFLGVLLDYAGQDLYYNMHGVGTGGAHDWAVGILVDRADDFYMLFTQADNGAPVSIFVADTMNSRIQVFMNATASPGDSER